jgi:hypothetical protein
MLQKIKNVSEYVKDDVNSAVLSVDGNSLKAYKLRREQSREYEAAINDINNIKSELSEIKSLLTQLVGNNSGN